MAIITISRMYGSGGSHVAQRVATALGWNLLDNALVDEVSHRLGMSRDEVSAHEERLPSLAERLASALVLSAPEALPALGGTSPVPPEERIIDVTKLVIQEAVQRDHAVLVGRGAQCMLADRPDALHVFCYAPRPALIAYEVNKSGVTAEKAAHIVDEMNHNREQYVKQVWKRDWRRMENYHVCVNTAALGLDGAAELVVRLAKERFD
ncbi:MAG TPA: cytidylate kinase-like family protein [Gemmatimonadaceae bacterium]|nr:cytidylate kinase-like family protein [Gemmatimonadaceae bacterium]